MPKIGFLKTLVVVGDRVLIKAMDDRNRTTSGLYLPPNVTSRDEVRTGRVVRVGPGYPVPATQDFDEFLKEKKEPIHYIPLQVQAGDIAIFLRKEGIDIEYENEKFILVNQAAILMLEREEIAGLD